MDRKKTLQSVVVLFFAGLSGFLLFCGIYGIDFLNPANVDWCILKSSDTGQHFLGGWAFLRDQWRWPLGIFYGLSDPDPASITLVDGIPLAAFIVKLIRGPASVPFQYLGMWNAVAFVLQGFFAMQLMRKLTRDIFFQFTGVFFLLLSVPFLNLGTESTALSSHFFILWALYLMLCKWQKKVFFQWGALLVSALMVHPYIAAMCGAVYCGSTLQAIWRAWRQRNKKITLNIVSNWLLVCGSCLIVLYILGVPHIGLKSSAMVFGQSQINLNCLINPQSGSISALIAPMPIPMEAENLYMGAGGLLLFVFFLPGLCKLLKRDSSLWRYYGFSILFLASLVLFAVNCRIYAGKELLIHLIFPPEIKNIAGVFRAAGRFAWPVWYLIMALSVVRVAKEKSLYLKFFIVFLAIVLQIYDLGNGIIAHLWARNMARREKIYECPYSRFVQLTEGRKKLYYACSEKTFVPPVYFALKNNMIVEDFYFPRQFFRSRRMTAFNKMLKEGKIDNEYIYILSDDEVKKLLQYQPEWKKYIYATNERSIMILPAFSNHP